ncbi:MAG: diaminopimelate epimerase [Crocinitomicaceae bacterium]|nr:diaminopimelate epimerase [Crocinitomicaceae bacterium]
MIEFYKYQGTGNDFILIDNRSTNFKSDKISFAQKWCDRRFGIGSDGIIFIQPSLAADFYVDFYNPDGSQSFCGNGSRCAVRFAQFLGVVSSRVVSFEAIDGLHEAIVDAHEISIHMKDVTEIRKIDQDFYMHTGSPHYISVDEKEEKNILEFGRKIRYSEAFKPGGTNVNLIKTLERNHIHVKTYERGVEDETFSCGTGVTACALTYAILNNLTNGTIITDVKGGRLHVKFEKHENGFKNVWLQGPAEFVYQGIIDDKA